MEKKTVTAIYAGSFDPITNGHIDILKRALNAFDKVILLVANNPNKSGVFSVQERIDLVKASIKGLKNVVVDSNDGLTVQYAKAHNAKFLIRGLRAVTDFEYEFSLAATNDFIDNNIDSVFFMAHKETSFISSSSIIELAKNKVDVSNLVPTAVNKALIKKFK